jgi:hypothetical protein
VSEYVVIDNNILDVLNLQDDDKLPLNSLHILEECNIPIIRCNTMTRISKRVINMNIFTKEISHKNTDSTQRIWILTYS